MDIVGTYSLCGQRANNVIVRCYRRGHHYTLTLVKGGGVEEKLVEKIVVQTLLAVVGRSTSTKEWKRTSLLQKRSRLNQRIEKIIMNKGLHY